jgi:hypothetical protein
VGSRSEVDRKVWPRTNKDKSSEHDDTTSTYISRQVASLLGENRQMQQTPSYLSSLTVKLVIGKTSSLLRHDSSEQLPPLDYMWDQNDLQTSNIRPFLFGS